MANKKLSVMSL